MKLVVNHSTLKLRGAPDVVFKVVAHLKQEEYNTSNSFITVQPGTNRDHLTGATRLPLMGCFTHCGL
jgi:hypothetical protein